MDDFIVSNQSNNNRGNRNVIRVEGALIEEVFIDNRTAYVTISYGVMGDFDMIHMNLMQLIVNRDTIIMDQFGQDLSLWDLRKGMLVDAEFSSAMTRSIPPQARAFRILVINQNGASNIREGRVLRVDNDNRFLYTGNANDELSQMRFVITRATTITDRRGNQINLRDIRPGQTVRVEHATFQTPSIPPQTTAFRVWVL